MRTITILDIWLFFITTEVRNIDSYSNPKYNWPLGDSSYAFETVQGLSPSSDNDQCGFYFAGSNPSLTEYVPLSLNGYDYPYVDVTFSDDNTFQDFSFSFYVNPSSTTGCLLHYKGDSTVSGNILDFRLSLQNSDIELLFSGNSFEDVVTVPNTLTVDTWHFVSFARHYTNGKVELNIGNVQVFNLDDSFMNNKILYIPGKTRVGSSFDANIGPASGQFMCLQFYDDIFSRFDQSFATDGCKVVNWDKTPTGLPSGPGLGCPVSTTSPTTTVYTSTTITESTTASLTITESTSLIITESTTLTTPMTMETEPKMDVFSSYFDLFIKDKKLSYFHISSVKTTTFLRCAQKCLGTDTCLAMAVESIEYRHKNCTMYSGIDQIYFFNCSGAVLYKKRSTF